MHLAHIAQIVRDYDEAVAWFKEKLASRWCRTNTGPSSTNVG
jgi:hypothetical protein